MYVKLWAVMTNDVQQLMSRLDTVWNIRPHTFVDITGHSHQKNISAIIGVGISPFSDADLQLLIIAIYSGQLASRGSFTYMDWF